MIIVAVSDISYELFQDINNNNIFSFIEEWENKDVLDKHMNSEHFQKIVPKLRQFQETDSEVNVYEIIL